MGLFRKPLHSHAVRLYGQEDKCVDNYIYANAMGTPGYREDFNRVKEKFVKKLLRSYRKNDITRDAVEGIRSVYDTVRLYTHGDDYELHGKGTWKAEKRNRQLRRILGIRNPLEPKLFVSDEKKIKEVLERARAVDEMIEMYRERVLRMYKEKKKEKTGFRIAPSFSDALETVIEETPESGLFER